MTAGLFVVEGRQGSSNNAYFYPFPGTATQTEPLVCAEHPWGPAKSGMKPHGSLGLAQLATTRGRIH